MAYTAGKAGIQKAKQNLIGQRNRTWTPEVVRAKIRTSMLINRLQNHVAGKLEMSKTQIQAAGILLRKTLPDMVATTIETHPLERMRDEELLITLAAIRGYLANPGIGISAPGGSAETSEPQEAGSVPTVQ